MSRWDVYTVNVLVVHIHTQMNGDEDETDSAAAVPAKLPVGEYSSLSAWHWGRSSSSSTWMTGPYTHKHVRDTI